MEPNHQSVFKDTVLNPSMQNVERQSKTSEQSDQSDKQIKSMKQLSSNPTIPSNTILTQILIQLY